MKKRVYVLAFIAIITILLTAFMILGKYIDAKANLSIYTFLYTNFYKLYLYLATLDKLYFIVAIAAFVLLFVIFFYFIEVDIECKNENADILVVEYKGEDKHE